MENDEYETVSTGPVLRIVRWVVPWVALALVLWALSGVWGSFQQAKQVADAAAAASTEPTVTATSTVASAETTVTGMVAVARVDVSLRAQADMASEILATARKGSTLTILSRQGTYFRVKDPAGHVGWIPNDVKYIDVRVAPKPKKK
jgi:hypothetical protein